MSTKRCPCEKHNWSALVFVPVAIAQLFSAPDLNTDKNDFLDDNGDGLLFELDGDDRGFDGIFDEKWRKCMWVLSAQCSRSVIIYSFGTLIRIHSIYIINTYIPLMDRLTVWSWMRSWNAHWWRSWDPPWCSSKSIRKVCVRKTRLNHSLLF
jgi:hypothetical protein